MANESKAAVRKRLERRRKHLRRDPLEVWIREYAATLAPSSRRAALLAIANKRKQQTKQAIAALDRELEELELEED
jgi:hypothetical protein